MVSIHKALIRTTIAGAILSAMLFFGTTALAGEKPAEEPSPKVLDQRAKSAYMAGDFKSCSDLATQSLKAGMEGTTAPYNAACCAALTGQTDLAFEHLDLALERGYYGVTHLEKDKDLESLSDDPRWAEVLTKIRANWETYRSSVNGELLDLYGADQADRTGNITAEDWAGISERDEARRKRVLELLNEGALKVGQDFFHAAMVLQHGNEPEHYKKAHELAKKAAELDPSLNSAKWLSAAAWDRYLWNTDQPQIYGTQFTRPNAESEWTQEPFDREAVSDEERAALNVPSLAEAEDRLKRMNEQLKKPAETAAKNDDDP